MNQLLLWLALGLLPTHAHAQDEVHDYPDLDAVQEEVKSNRTKMLEGSKSPYSGQLNIYYSGSSISHPFSSVAPNPAGFVPPPLVSLSGTISMRKRLDDSTTAGIGTGVTTYTPFQGPKNTSIADPYVDLAHAYNALSMHHRVGFYYTMWTNEQFHNDYGYRHGFTVIHESSDVISDKLTAGLFVGVDYNLFSGQSAYAQSTAKYSILANQTQWDLVVKPFFEYAINDTFNLRAVTGIQFYNNRNLSGPFIFEIPAISEGVGLGIQLSHSVHLYPFIQVFPSKLMIENTLTGFNVLVNLF